MLGAPCWPLQRITSPVKESWPPSPKAPRVLVWLAACGSFAGSSVIEKLGLTPAIGEFSSQSCDRSKSRACFTARMNFSDVVVSSSALTSRPISASPRCCRDGGESCGRDELAAPVSGVFHA